jgi:Zn-dependent protease
VKSSLKLGKVLGIPIGVNYTWFIIFVMVTMSLATAYFPGRYGDWSRLAYWGVGLLTSLLFFSSVLLHELAHSAVAKAWGIPVRSITLFIFGGVANISREPDRPLSEFLIAIAGPAASLLLALGFGLVWLVGQTTGLEALTALGIYLAGINLSLALFNLVPGFPLDGGRVFRSIVWALSGNMNKATRWAATLGRIIAVVMIVGGGILVVRGDWSGLWLAFIGWFLENAASQSAQQAHVREALEGYTVSDFAARSCQAVDQNMPLDWVVRDYVMPNGAQCFVVTDGQQAQGAATWSQIQKVPRQSWGWTPIRQIMTPFSALRPVASGEPAYAVLERMFTEGQSLLPVIDGSRLIGLVRQESLLGFAQGRRSVG